MTNQDDKERLLRECFLLLVDYEKRRHDLLNQAPGSTGWVSSAGTIDSEALTLRTFFDAYRCIDPSSNHMTDTQVRSAVVDATNASDLLDDDQRSAARDEGSISSQADKIFHKHIDAKLVPWEVFAGSFTERPIYVTCCDALEGRSRSLLHHLELLVSTIQHESSSRAVLGQQEQSERIDIESSQRRSKHVYDLRTAIREGSTFFKRIDAVGEVSASEKLLSWNIQKIKDDRLSLKKELAEAVKQGTDWELSSTACEEQLANLREQLQLVSQMKNTSMSLARAEVEDELREFSRVLQQRYRLQQAQAAALEARIGDVGRMMVVGHVLRGNRAQHEKAVTAVEAKFNGEGLQWLIRDDSKQDESNNSNSRSLYAAGASSFGNIDGHSFSSPFQVASTNSATHQLDDGKSLAAACLDDLSNFQGAGSAEVAARNAKIEQTVDFLFQQVAAASASRAVVTQPLSMAGPPSSSLEQQCFITLAGFEIFATVCRFPLLSTPVLTFATFASPISDARDVSRHHRSLDGRELLAATHLLDRSGFRSFLNAQAQLGLRTRGKYFSELHVLGAFLELTVMPLWSVFWSNTNNPKSPQVLEEYGSPPYSKLADGHQQLSIIHSLTPGDASTSSAFLFPGDASFLSSPKNRTTSDMISTTVSGGVSSMLSLLSSFSKRVSRLGIPICEVVDAYVAHAATYEGSEPASTHASRGLSDYHILRALLLATISDTGDNIYDKKMEVVGMSSNAHAASGFAALEALAHHGAELIFVLDNDDGNPKAADQQTSSRRSELCSMVQAFAQEVGSSRLSSMPGEDFSQRPAAPVVASLDSVSGWLLFALCAAANTIKIRRQEMPRSLNILLSSRHALFKQLHDAAVALALSNFDVVDLSRSSGARASTVLRCMPRRLVQEWLWAIMPGENPVAKLNGCAMPFVMFAASFEYLALSQPTDVMDSTFKALVRPANFCR